MAGQASKSLMQEASMDKVFRQPRASRDFAQLLDTTDYTPLPDD